VSYRNGRHLPFMYRRADRRTPGRSAAVTDDELIAYLRAAFAQAEAEAQAATSRAGRYAAALAALDGAPEPEAPPPAPPVSESETRPRGGQPGNANRSKYDYAEIARVARAALDAGRPMMPDVAAEFEVTPATANWLITEARRKGHDIPRRGQRRGQQWAQPTSAPSAPAHHPVVASVMAADRQPAPADDDDECEPLTWGANGRLPIDPKQAKIRSVDGMYGPSGL
jgi:hypothetical protein